MDARFSERETTFGGRNSVTHDRSNTTPKVETKKDELSESRNFAGERS